MAFTICWQV